MPTLWERQNRAVGGIRVYDCTWGSGGTTVAFLHMYHPKPLVSNVLLKLGVIQTCEEDWRVSNHEAAPPTKTVEICVLQKGRRSMLYGRRVGGMPRPK